MPKVTFLPQEIAVEVEPQTKLLRAGIVSKSGIRFGCAACSCGTCAVQVISGDVSVPSEDEKDLLIRLGLGDKAGVRLACQARVMGTDVMVDLDFQDQYDVEAMQPE